MTLLDADALFDQVALAEIEEAKIAAKYDAKIAALKEDAANLAAEHKERKARLWEKVASFMMAHPHLFDKPRSRTTSFGSYGMKTGKPRVEIKDAAAVIGFSMEGREDMHLTYMTPSIDKDYVRKAIEGGVAVPGAALIPAREELFGKVKKELLDAARQNEN